MPTRQLPASIRYNNPGAQWPGPVATKFGSTGSDRIGGGNLIARFPSPVNGAAAHIALLDRSYTGITLSQAVRKWTGGTSDPSGYIQSVAKAAGIKPDTVLTHDMFANPKFALPFAQAMAGEEAGQSGTLTPEQWQQGYDMAFPSTGQPTVEIPTGSGARSRTPLEVNAGDTSHDPGSISTGGDFTLGGDNSLGSDLNAEFTGQQYSEPIASYPETDAASFTPLPSNYPYGEPTVETPTATATPTAGVSSGNLDSEPSLFPDATGANSFNEWWKTPTDAPASVTVNAGDGGSIWQGEDALGSFGGDTSLGNDLSAGLSDMGFGSGYPAPEATAPEAPFSPTPPPTGGSPVDPGTLPQDYEWTTSSGDRRYLPGSEPAAPTRTVSGLDLRTFGAPPTDNSLTLGAYLSTPLANMNFGGGYPNVESGTTVDQRLTDQQMIEQQRQEMGLSTQRDSSGNYIDVRNNALSNPSDNQPTYGDTLDPNTEPDSRYPGTTGDPFYNGEAAAPEVRTALDPTTGEVRLNSGSPSFGIIGQFGLPLHVTPTARTQNFNYGYGQSLNSQENAGLMASTQFGGNTNVQRVDDEERVANSEFGSHKRGQSSSRYKQFMDRYGLTGVHTSAALTAGATGGG